MEEQTVLSKISLFHMFTFIDCFKIVQKGRKYVDLQMLICDSKEQTMIRA